MSTATDLIMIRAGISYRQLDYWVNKGWVEPRYRHRNGDPADRGKSGYVRDFTDHEAQVIVHMGRLTAAGVRPDAAAKAARSMVNAGLEQAVLGRGVIVALDGERSTCVAEVEMRGARS